MDTEMNKLYHFFWYKIVSKFISHTPGVTGHHKIITAKLKLARIFGVVHGVMLGDSEIATWDICELMSGFQSLVVNIGVPGSTPLDWFKYFTTMGKSNYLLIKSWTKAKPIFSIGGNCSLLCKMAEIPDTMILIHNMFQGSWILLIPPVYSEWMAKLYTAAGFQKSQEIIEAEISTIRNYQRQIWSPFVIDTYAPFVNKETGGPLPGVLIDLVHFSSEADRLIEAVLNKII